MDNQEQIEEIKKYHFFLVKVKKNPLDIEDAARLWIVKYAKKWRQKHLF